MFLLIWLYDIKTVEMGNFITNAKKYVEIFPQSGLAENKTKYLFYLTYRFNLKIIFFFCDSF